MDVTFPLSSNSAVCIGTPNKKAMNRNCSQAFPKEKHLDLTGCVKYVEVVRNYMEERIR